MGDVLILRDYDTDNVRFYNSVKAAYLYSDKVKVYDMVNPCANVSITEEFLNKQVESKDIKKIKKRFPKVFKFRNDDFSDFFDESVKLMSSNYISELEKQELGKLILCLISHMESACSEEASKRRTQNKEKSEQEINEEYKKLNVELVEPQVGFSKYLRGLDLHVQFSNAIGTKMSIHNKNTESVNSTELSNYLSNSQIIALPCFDMATLDEIVDIKNELKPYIRNYNDAISELAIEIKTFQNAEALEQKELDFYKLKIKKRVKEINERVEGNNLFRTIGKNLISNETFLACMGTLFLSFVVPDAINQLFSIWGKACTILGAASLKGYIDYQDENMKIKKDGFYFLYKAGQKLKR